jgi:hypothetical protein
VKNLTHWVRIPASQACLRGSASDRRASEAVTAVPQAIEKDLEAVLKGRSLQLDACERILASHDGSGSGSDGTVPSGAAVDAPCPEEGARRRVRRRRRLSILDNRSSASAAC